VKSHAQRSEGRVATGRAKYLAPVACIATAGALIGGGLTQVPDALGHHEATRAHTIRTIKRIYPELYRAELHRPKVSWNHLRREAIVRWDEEHPAAMREHKMQHLADIATPEANKALARMFFGSEYPCAAEIIEGETAGTWDEQIWNYEGSGAYGLGQARPRDKMLAYGADAYTNPLTQMEWFEGYAEARYGGVCEASAHWTAVVSW
jgi:hypothetical protein